MLKLHGSAMPTRSLENSECELQPLCLTDWSTADWPQPASLKVRVNRLGSIMPRLATVRILHLPL